MTIDPLDPLDLDAELSDGERAVRDRVRAWVDERVRPGIADLYARAHWPREIAPELGKLGVLGMHIHGHGCPGASNVEYGLACLELEAADSGLRTFVSVQGSLAMTAIHEWGSEEHKLQWLPRMARGDAVGCFALTEPDTGSDPGSMATVARREGGDWVLDGRKRWIGMGSIADVAVVWAKAADDGRVRGFLVPAGTPGFTATDIEDKLSLRASLQSELTLDGVRLPEAARLPGAEGLRAPFTSLNEARYGISWGVMGAARDCYACALDYARRREVFGRPLAGFQLTQAKLADMALELVKGTQLALRLGRLKDAGRLENEQISFGKLNNVREALEIARAARTILGGEGIRGAYPVMRHMANLESVMTYEGTSEIHALIIGHALTGERAFA